MGSFGATGYASGAAQALTDQVRAYKATLGSTQKITRLVAYVDGTHLGASGANARAVIYSDSSGPNALLVESAEVAIAQSQAAGWVTFGLSTPLTLTAADYWLGLHTSVPDGGAYLDLYGDTGTRTPKYVSDTYSDGAADPWVGGTDETNPRDLSIYADWGTGHSAAVSFDAAPIFSATATHTTTLPLITAPTSSSSNPAGDVTLTGILTRDGLPTISYEWEIDTANPPSSAHANYEQIITGYAASGVARSVVASNLTAGTWYARVRATDGTSTSNWSTVLTFYVFATVLLKSGSSVTRTISALANKIFAKVEGTSIVASATNSDTAYPPIYADSPREKLVLIKGGDTTAAQAVADAYLVVNRVERYAVSGLQVPLDDGLLIEVGDRVAVVHALSGVDGWYPVRRVTHDFKGDTTSIDVGEIDRVPDDETLIFRMAADLENVKKGIA